MHVVENIFGLKSWINFAPSATKLKGYKERITPYPA